jgi:hypothetical protein
LAGVRELLIELRDGCGDAERAVFLASILRGVESGVGGPQKG